MNTNRIFNLGLMLGFLMPAASFAEHGDVPGGTVGRLKAEATELSRVVDFSMVDPYDPYRYYHDRFYRVKRDTARFKQATILLDRCVNGGRLGGEPGRGGETEPFRSDIEPMDHGEQPRNCDLELQRVQSSFTVVERYLYDTNYDFPQVYRQFLETSEALSDVLRERGVNP